MKKLWKNPLNIILKSSHASVKFSVCDSTITKTDWKKKKNSIQWRVPKTTFWVFEFWSLSNEKKNIFLEEVCPFTYRLKLFRGEKRYQTNSLTWQWWYDGLGLPTSFRTQSTCQKCFGPINFFSLAENPEREGWKKSTCDPEYTFY